MLFEELKSFFFGGPLFFEFFDTLPCLFTFALCLGGGFGCFASLFFFALLFLYPFSGLSLGCP